MWGASGCRWIAELVLSQADKPVAILHIQRGHNLMEGPSARLSSREHLMEYVLWWPS